MKRNQMTPGERADAAAKIRATNPDPAQQFRARARAIAAARGWTVEFEGFAGSVAWFLDAQGKDMAQSSTMAHLEALESYHGVSAQVRELTATSSTTPAPHNILPRGLKGDPDELLAWVARELDWTTWTADTCARIAAHLRAAGFEIREPQAAPLPRPWPREPASPAQLATGRKSSRPDERWYYSVAPRYTPGSPALVSRRTGEEVAKEERDAYERHLEGLYGEEAVDKAKRLGLSRIVWSRVSEHRTRKGCVILNHDAITGETFQTEVL
jgi:hypothetical protein